MAFDPSDDVVVQALQVNLRPAPDAYCLATDTTVIPAPISRFCLMLTGRPTSGSRMALAMKLMPYPMTQLMTASTRDSSRVCMLASLLEEGEGQVGQGIPGHMRHVPVAAVRVADFAPHVRQQVTPQRLHVAGR